MQAVSVKRRRHRWAEKVCVSPHKSEAECLNGCGVVKVSRHEFDGQRDIHWTEYWRGLDRCEGSGTPICVDAKAPATYDARNYPL